MAEDKHAGGRPPLYETPEALEQAIHDYFNPEEVVELRTDAGIQKVIEGRKPREKVTITGLAYYLGFESRQSFYDYEEKPEFSYIIKKARLRVEMGYEENLQGNNVAGSIFALKNMGWKDKTEQEHSGSLTIQQITGMNVT